MASPEPGKPILRSYDSAEECSFYHWFELCKLVDESNDPEPEEPLRATLSEV
jgi:hypothetical protein